MPSSGAAPRRRTAERTASPLTSNHVAPATPADAYGLLKSAIRDDNPVVVLESEMMYAWKGEVPEEEFLVPIGKARIAREGKDISLVTFSKPIKLVMEAAQALAAKGVEAEVIDLRSIRPLDEEALYASVRKTGRCVVVDESWPVASVGSHVAWLVSKNCFDVLDAQVELVSGEDVPKPYNHALELAAQPSAEKVLAAARKVLYREDL